ncbi:MAG: EF2563 family selenium-dependent molybdenum hydroxylase system protein [Acidobacteria bacterium]|nr:EF2563 family selenium-dependent molybdenum hydroxylase system protein [Acidobacteriota bacterium]
MNSGEMRVLIRGAGELASATAVELYHAGFTNILMLEIRYPGAVRRNVCFSEAVFEGMQHVQGVTARLAGDLDQVAFINRLGDIAVAVMPLQDALEGWKPHIFIEATMQRKNLGLKPTMAPIVIALGPGYIAKRDCHAVVDTFRGPQVGAVLEDTGEHLVEEPPAEIMGYATERVLKAAREGIFFTSHHIGDTVGRGERVGTVVSVFDVDDFRKGVPVDVSYAVKARIAGVIRGLLRDGVPVKEGAKIGDIDPRGRTDDLEHISDKARRVAEGVYEALVVLLREREQAERAG